jgi:hypothetical protein
MYLFKLQNSDTNLHDFLKVLWFSKYIREPSKNHDDTFYLDNIDKEKLSTFSMIKKLNFNGIYLDEWCRFFVCKKFCKSSIHIDGIPPRNCVINFPISYAEEVPMIWYKNLGSNGLTSDRIRMVTAVEDQCQELYRDYLDIPSIFNTSEFHAIDNSKNKNNRVIFSLRFSGNPSFDEIKKILLS